MKDRSGKQASQYVLSLTRPEAWGRRACPGHPWQALRLSGLRNGGDAQQGQWQALPQLQESPQQQPRASPPDPAEGAHPQVQGAAWVQEQ